MKGCDWEKMNMKFPMTSASQTLAIILCANVREGRVVSYHLCLGLRS